MIQAYQIVHKVLQRFRGLSVKVAGVTGKSDKWYLSHGVEPRTQNPLSHGNISEVEHYMRYCRTFEVVPGAGQYLNNLVHKELAAEFAENDAANVSQNEMHSEILDENCDVHRWLINFKFDDATRPQHEKFQDECDEAIDAIAKAKARSRLYVDRSVREQVRAALGTNGNGGKR